MRLSSTILVLLCLATAAVADTGRRVILVTIGPGDEVYEQFGHNMIEVVGDRGYGQNVVFHWGNFDPTQSGFVWRFIQGRMMYSMVAQPADEIIQEYRDQHRLITRQELHLSESQIDELIMRCEYNRLPANALYPYDYFKDNCSTRVRDMLDKVTQGQIRSTVDAQPPLSNLSYRQHTVRLMQHDLLLSLGTDFVIGPSCDRPLAPWEDCFLPAHLAGYLKPMTQMLDDPVPTDRAPEPLTVPDRRLPMALVGLAIGAAMVGLTWRGHRRAPVLAAGAWWFINGFGGALLLYMWCFTDHAATYANQNLLCYSPLGWVALASLVRAKWRRAGWPRRLAGAMLALAVLALLLHGWALKQDNLHFILLALPLHAGAFLTIRRLTRGASLSEVAES